MDINCLEAIRELKENRPTDYSDQLQEICDIMEEILGPAEMWNTLRPGFGVDELAENLEYIAKECDI